MSTMTFINTKFVRIARTLERGLHTPNGFKYDVPLIELFGEIQSDLPIRSRASFAALWDSITSLPKELAEADSRLGDDRHRHLVWELVQALHNANVKAYAIRYTGLIGAAVHSPDDVQNIRKCDGWMTIEAAPRYANLFELLKSLDAVAYNLDEVDERGEAQFLTAIRGWLANKLARKATEYEIADTWSE